MPVKDLLRSLAFYTKTLEWKVDWSGESVGCVSRDGHPVMLSELIPESATSWAYIGVANASLFDLYRERGVKVVEEPVNWSWGYQMKFADPDSNVLWMATASRDDMPCVDEEVLES